MPTGVAIARQLTAGGYDLVITSSTPSMQAVANNNRDGKTRHLFTLVADPFASGVGLDRANPLKHPPLHGRPGRLPAGRESLCASHAGCSRPCSASASPWNPSETNSLIFVERGRKVAREAMG